MSADSTSLVNVGDILAGKYRVERVLGMGAMGVVVAAMHLDLQKLRAIKFMLPSALEDAEGVERFMREARAVADLKSQHVVKVYDVGKLEDGAPYIVMEYLEGEDLKLLLRRRKALPVHEAVKYMLQVCEAVGEAHSMGIVHRDLKPANIFLTSGVGGVPCAKVLDFGIAKLTGKSELDMTSTDTIMGSPLYMSPEQMRSSRYVDARSDIWALGVILYNLVTGGVPFEAESTQVLFASVLRDVPLPPTHWRPDLPGEVEAVILRCLEKDLARRYQTVVELAAALEPFRDAQIRRTQPSIPHGLTQTEKMAAPPSRSFPPHAPVSNAGLYNPPAAVTGAPASAPGLYGPPSSSHHPVSAPAPHVPGPWDGARPWEGAAAPYPAQNPPATQTERSWTQTGAVAPRNRSLGLSITAAAAAGAVISTVLVIALLSRNNASPVQATPIQLEITPPPGLTDPSSNAMPTATPPRTAIDQGAIEQVIPQATEPIPEKTVAKTPGAAPTTPKIASTSAPSAPGKPPQSQPKRPGSDAFGDGRK
jgi:serine/threonine-protein kinase